MRSLCQTTGMTKKVMIFVIIVEGKITLNHVFTDESRNKIFVKEAIATSNCCNIQFDNFSVCQQHEDISGEY